METIVFGSWLYGEWGEGWVVAGVIEAVMSPLMVRWERMKKATAQQVMISRVCSHVILCVCVCVSPGSKSLHLNVFSNYSWWRLLIKVHEYLGIWVITISELTRLLCNLFVCVPPPCVKMLIQLLSLCCLLKKVLWVLGKTLPFTHKHGSSKDF